MRKKQHIASDTHNDHVQLTAPGSCFQTTEVSFHKLLCTHWQKHRAVNALCIQHINIFKRSRHLDIWTPPPLQTHTHTTHTVLVAFVHHFAIMWTDLWPWGQMVVLNSITVRVQPALHIHCSSTATHCWCSSKINAPTPPPPSPLEAMFYMLSLLWPPVILIMSRLAKEEWLGCVLKSMSLT